MSPKHRAGWVLCVLLLLVTPAGYPQDASSTGPGSLLGEPAAGGSPLDEESLPIGEEAPVPAGGEFAPAPLLSTWDFLRMLLILGGIVGLIYLLFFLLKRGQGRRVVDNDLIRILGSRNLTGNKSLHLVEVGGSIFLVGAGESGIALISEIRDKETADRLRLESAREASAARRSFAAVLAGLFRPAAGAMASASDPLEETVDYMKKQQERLKNM